MLQHIDFPKRRLFGIDFDAITMRDAVDWVFRQVAVGPLDATRYVVTPNVHLTMRHQDDAHFRTAVHQAALTIVDGMPLVTASRWLSKPVPERVAGSDLVYCLFEATIPEMPLRVFLLGAANGVAERAAAVIADRWPAVQVVGTCSPDYGFEHDRSQTAAILKTVNVAELDLLIVGLGAPKQEMWVHKYQDRIQAPVTLCGGGTIDFLAGEQSRAPDWFRTSGLEWMWRIATNPRRLALRYLNDAIRIPRLLLDEVTGLCPVCQTNSGSSVDVSQRPITEQRLIDSVSNEEAT